MHIGGPDGPLIFSSTAAGSLKVFSSDGRPDVQPVQGPDGLGRNSCAAACGTRGKR